MLGRRNRSEKQEAERLALNPYLGLAEDLQRRVLARVASEDDMEKIFAQVVGAREQEMVVAAIEAKLEELPAEKVLSMYATLLGDEAVNEPIRRLGTIKQRELGREARRAELKDRATHSREVDMRQFEEGEVVTVGLFNPSLEQFRKSARWPGWAGRIMQVRVREPEAGLVQVLSDEIGDYKIPKTVPGRTTFEDHALVRLGAEIAGKQKEFEPILSYGSQLDVYSQSTEEVRHLQLDVGYVCLDGVVILSYSDLIN